MKLWFHVTNLAPAAMHEYAGTSRLANDNILAHPMMVHRWLRQRLRYSQLW